MSGCLFVFLEQTNLKTQKTGLHTDLLVTRKFCSPLSLEPRLLKFKYEAYYGNYTVQDSLDHY